MTRKRIFLALEQLGEYLLKPDDRLAAHVHRASVENLWFTKENIYQALDQISRTYLSFDALQEWVSSYTMGDLPAQPKSVGLVMAGNIPLVGMHDVLSVLVSGHLAKIKLSDKDPYLLPFVLKKLGEIDPGVAERIGIADRLKDFDAVIATGSDNAALYFKSYFGKYPHIIRQHRNGVGILTGDETPGDLSALGRDIFQYFGLGCRNVSKIYVPEGFDFEVLTGMISEYAHLADHPKYRNNLDYNAAVYILNKIAHYSWPNLMLAENPELASRIGVVHYEFYDSPDSLEHRIEAQAERIQCIISGTRIGRLPVIPFGQAQLPTLKDYADGVDTLAFLIKL